MDDFFSLEEAEGFFSRTKVTIAMQKRNGKKCVTIVTGMAEDLDVQMILSHIKKKHNCNGAVLKDDTFGEVLMFTGDQRENFFTFLIDEQINQSGDIIVKGM
jgi:translation initiation factor SUI1